MLCPVCHSLPSPGGFPAYVRMHVVRGYAFYIWRIYSLSWSSFLTQGGRRPPDLFQGVVMFPICGVPGGQHPCVGLFSLEGCQFGFRGFGCLGSYPWPGHQRRLHWHFAWSSARTSYHIFDTSVPHIHVLQPRSVLFCVNFPVPTFWISATTTSIEPRRVSAVFCPLNSECSSTYWR